MASNQYTHAALVALLLGLGSTNAGRDHGGGGGGEVVSKESILVTASVASPTVFKKEEAAVTHRRDELPCLQMQRMPILMWESYQYHHPDHLTVAL